MPKHDDQSRLRRTAGRALVGVLLLFAAASAHAQFPVTGLPRVSPAASVSQTVGVTDIKIQYHRPAVNDRDVWGTLVPYDQPWRAGANDNTTISFSTDVEVEGQPLAAGIYGLHMIPADSAPWTVVFSHDHQAWGSFAYDQARDALRVEAEPRAAAFQERLEYRFEQADNRSAEVMLHWHELAISFTVSADTPNRALEHLTNQLTTLPRFSWQGWNSAANYCLQAGVNDDRCMQWVDRSISMNRNAQNLMVKASLLVLDGDTDAAAELEAEALETATEAEINALGYAYLFQRNDAQRAVELFRHNAEAHPESWNVHDSLAEGLAALGETDKAIAAYEKAHAIAPAPQKARIAGVIESLRSGS